MPTREFREPAFNAPGVIVALIGVMALVHAARALLLDGEGDFRLLLDWGFIPARWSLWQSSGDVAALAEAAGGQWGATQFVIATYLAREGGSGVLTLVTHAVLHGGLLHLGFNALWLLAFGTPVARRTGTARFLLLFALGAAAGALAHALARPNDLGPLIGASGAVAAAMGAATRFVFGDGGWRGSEPQRVAPLSALLRNGRATGFIALWFAINLLFGLGAGWFEGLLGTSDGSIAWEAHLGGFAAGLLLMPWLDAPRRHGWSDPHD